MSTSTISFVRNISTTCVVRWDKKNFRMFQIINKRGTRAEKQQRAENPYHPHLMVNKRGLKSTGYMDNFNRFHKVQEKIPDIIVPDLKGFKLKPYVTYRADDIEQPEFTAETLFNCVYADKIIDDFDNNKLNPDGSPKEPSENEKLTAKQAKENASKTGADMYTYKIKCENWFE